MYRMTGVSIAAGALALALIPIGNNASRPVASSSAPVASIQVTSASVTNPVTTSTRQPSRLAAPSSHTGKLIPQPVQGREALEQIGDKLGSVARANQMSPAQLRQVLTDDHTAWLGRSGNLYFAEDVQPAITGAALPTAPPVGNHPLDQTFNLHSLPGSNRTIYLDFNGYDLTPSNSWVDYQYLPSRSYYGFTLDTDPYTFYNTELAYIQTVWRIVAEKYAAFDVDVTTEDVGSDKWDRSAYADQQYGVHVVITNDPAASQAACSNNCSGVAWIGTFGLSASVIEYWQPAWVFSNMTYGSAALTANTVAHEIGHTGGLNHDGTTTQAYYGGHSNWSPIMGGGINGVQQFSKGEYSGANNTEDDFYKFNLNGLATRADDQPNTPANATSTPAASSQAYSGVITTQTDSDVFAITTSCAANFTASATGIGEGSMLDIALAILDPQGTQITNSDPISGQDTSFWPAKPTGLDASATAAGTTPGTYYFRVRGTGKGNPLNTGYSAYSSIGSYDLTISAACTDGGTLSGPSAQDPPGDDPPAEDPPGDDPPGEDPGDDPPVLINPRLDDDGSATAALAPSTPALRALPGARGGPRTIRIFWPDQDAADSYRISIAKTGRKRAPVRVIDTDQASLELKLRPGAYRFRIQALGEAGDSGWSGWSAAVRAR